MHIFVVDFFIKKNTLPMQNYGGFHGIGYANTFFKLRAKDQKDLWPKKESGQAAAMRGDLLYSEFSNYLLCGESLAHSKRMIR